MEYELELYHHGIKGQKWGIRRFQNPDGTLTKAGSLRYMYGTKAVKKLNDKEEKNFDKYSEQHKKWVQADKQWNRDNGKNALSEHAKLGSRIQTNLNTLDKLRAASYNAIGISNERIRKYDKKLEKLSGKEQTDRVKAKTQELKRKKQFEEDSIAFVSDRKDRAVAYSKWLVNEYSNMGFDISSKPTVRTVNRGRDIAAYVLGGYGGVLIYEHQAMRKGHPNTLPGTKYKVRVKK